MGSFEQRLRGIKHERQLSRGAQQTSNPSVYPDNRLWLYRQAIKNTQRRCRRTF